MKSNLSFKFNFLIAIFLLLANLSLAQDKINFFEGSLSYIIPSGSFAQHLKSNHLGVEMAYLRQIDHDQPFFWGMAMYYSSIGQFKAVTREVVDFGIYEFNSTTTSSLLGMDGKLRYYPNIYLGPLEWYVEAVIGFKWLFTYTNKVLIDNIDTSSGQFDEGQIGLNYGLNTGFQYKISHKTYLNLKGGYYPGLSIPYYAYNQDRIGFNTTLDKFDLKRSTTDIIRVDLGLTYRF